MRQLTYYVATSVDGFIAAENGSFDFFLPFDPGANENDRMILEDYPETLPVPARSALGLTAAPERFDTVLMGRGTYEPGLAAGLTSPYAHLRQYVFSASLDPATDPEVTVVPGDPVPLVRSLKQEDGLGIWLCGGGRLAATLADEIDTLVLKVHPVVAGSGIPLFAGGTPRRLTLSAHRTFPNGVVLATYTRPTSGGDESARPATRDPLEDLIGSAPGLSAATDLQGLRDEWER